MFFWLLFECNESLKLHFVLIDFYQTIGDQQHQFGSQKSINSSDAVYSGHSATVKILLTSSVIPKTDCRT